MPKMESLQNRRRENDTPLTLFDACVAEDHNE